MLLGLLLGLLVGLVPALTGAGGAIIAVPLLMLVFDWPVSQAAPVALLAVGSAAAVGAAMGLRAKIVRYRAAALMAGVGSVMTPLGLWAAQQLPPALLTLIFAAVLVFVAQQQFRQALRQLGGHTEHNRPQHAAPCRLSDATGRFHWTAPCARSLALAGALTGFATGLLGVGGGFVMVPVLRRVTDLAMNSIVATALMVVALVSGSATVAAAVAGTLDVAVGLPFALGAVAAMLAGRGLAKRISGPRLQQGFALVAAVVAGGMILKVLL